MWFHKVSRGKKSGLLPDDEEGAALLARMAEGECCQIKIVRVRSVAWNKMYFGICQIIGENQDPPRDKDSIDAEIRILSGHYDVLYVGTHEVRIPKRIAFDKMTADEWAEYFRKAEVAIAQRFGVEYLPEMAA